MRKSDENPTLGVIDGVEEPEEPATPEEGTPRDIDPEEWLSTSSEVVTDYVTIQVGGEPRRLKIAALTEEEFERVLEASKRKDPRGGGRKVHPVTFKRMIVAYSINKALGHVDQYGQMHPGAINHTQLNKQLSGQVTEIQNAVSKLSGFERDKEAAEQNKLFFD